MSHFVTVVLVKRGPDVEEQIERLMAPYSEHIEADPYQRNCWCVGRKAQVRAQAAATQAVGSIADLRERFTKYERQELVKASPFDHSSEELLDEQQQVWQQKYMRPYKLAEQAALDADPEKEAADPQCEECEGTGKETTTYNPKSKWDWYVIGGRWDGWIQGTERTSPDGGFNFGDEHHQLKLNSVLGDEYLAKLRKDGKTYMPYSLVTPDGEWHQRGEMGWWGISSGDVPKDEWSEKVLKLVETHAKDVVAVAVDCHI
jgi:hypothetical protein